MKKYVAILCIFALLGSILLFCGCSEKSSDVPKGMVLASSEEADYIMYVPQGWRIDKSTLYTSAFYSSGDATSISAAAYGMNFTDNSVDDWWNGFMEQLGAIYTDVSEVNTEGTTLGGADAVKYSFSACLNGQEYDYIITAALRNNYIYYITYTSTPDYYDNHLKELESVITNFMFK